MALPTSLKNVKIRDNTIHVGYSSNTGSITPHTYSSCMSLAADAIVQGNTIAGCIGGSSGSTNLMTVSSASCLIQSNVFIRGAGSPVGSYITFTGTNESVITGNMFDQTTIDGSNHQLVQGLMASSVYTANKNQVDYLVISLNDYTSTVDVEGFHGRLVNSTGSVVNSGLASSPNINFIIETSAQFSYGTVVPVGAFLPFGAKVLEMKVGVLGDDGGTTPTVNTGGTNELIIYAMYDDRSGTNYSTGTNSVLDPLNNNVVSDGATYSFNNTSAFNSLMAGTVAYLSLNLSSLDYTNYNKNIRAYVDFRLQSSAAFISIELSPLVVKFIY
jgi:hypothetical protein